jgi:hypothetical protein
LDDFEALLTRSKIVKSKDDVPQNQVSTEATPLPEGRRDRMISIISEAGKKSSSKPPVKKQSSKSSEKLPPIPTTTEFEREMRGIISAHHMGEDIESWLEHDLFGSSVNPSGLSRKTGFTGDEDFYRKGATSYIVQHLAANRDPELRDIGQRLLRKMHGSMGRRFLTLGAGEGLEPPEEDW